MDVSELLPIVVVVVVISIDLWIYTDAKSQVERGTPVIFWSPSFSVETPAAWLLGCLILSFIFIPLYFSLRNRNS